MNLQALNDAALRHPWRFSLGAGLLMGLLFAVLIGGVLYPVIAGVGHAVVQLLVVAWRGRQRPVSPREGPPAGR